MDMFKQLLQDISTQAHGSLWLILLLGFCFGLIIYLTRLYAFEKIAGFSLLEDTLVPKMLFFTIGLTSIGLYFFVEMGVAHYHIKPLVIGGIVLGGTLFGSAMAILGSCPGTAPIGMAQGRIDLWVAGLGGLVGGWFFTYYYDDFFASLIGQTQGKVTLFEWFESPSLVTLLLFGSVLLALSFWIPLKEWNPQEDDTLSVS
jgi:hypothetical protein